MSKEFEIETKTGHKIRLYAKSADEALAKHERTKRHYDSEATSVSEVKPEIVKPEWNQRFLDYAGSGR